MLKVAQIDDKGSIIGVKSNEVTDTDPGIHEKEMFMRFFEELNKHINAQNIQKKDAYDLFAYYAIQFDEHEGFRKDITDYISLKEKKECGNNADYIDHWKNFRDFVEKMTSIHES